MITLDEILDIFFNMLQECIESITLPTGKNLVPTFVYSLVVFIASLLCNLLGIFSLVNWRGALIATLLLLILAILERKGENEISRLYRVVKSGATALKGRTTRPGASLEIGRGTNPGDEIEEQGTGSSAGDNAMR